MNTRRMALTAVALLLAYLAGWLARGLRPEVACKERGGHYNEAWHTCLYVEPSDEALNNANDEAKHC